MFRARARVCVCVWCGVVWCGAVRCGAVRCGVVRCGAARRGAVRRGAGRCGAVRCGAVRCGAAWCSAAASRRAWLVFLILRLHTSPVVSENLLCRECQFLVIKSRIQARNPNFLWRHFDLRPQSRYVAAPKNVNSRSQKWGQKTYAFLTPTSDFHC